MLDNERARDLLLNGEFEVSYLEEFPVVDLTPLKNIAPPGSFVPIDDYIKMLKNRKYHLLALSPHPKNCSAVGITHDLSLMALVRIPSKQEEIDFGGDGSSDSPKSLQKLAEEEAETAPAAIDMASQIHTAHIEGRIANIEDLQSALANSPNPQVTLAALKQFGKEKIEFTQDNQKLEAGGRTRFPSKFSSKERYILGLQFRQGIDEDNNMAQARVINGSIDNSLTQALLRLRGIPVDIIEPSEALSLIASQLGRVTVMAEASICVDVFSGAPESLSLFRVRNKEEIRAALKIRMEQGELDLGS
jgi:hypothetical protein